MTAGPLDEGLTLRLDDDEGAGVDDLPDGDGLHEAPMLSDQPADSDLESLRDAFVEKFNARDLDALLTLVAPDVEVPDIAGEGRQALADEVDAIWDRAPGLLLTRGFLDDRPCALAWLPDEEGCWSRAALVCLSAADGLIDLVAVPDDIDALERAEADEPTGEELDEWQDWAEWDRGEETMPRARDRARP